MTEQIAQWIDLGVWAALVSAIGATKLWWRADR